MMMMLQTHNLFCEYFSIRMAVVDLVQSIRRDRKKASPDQEGGKKVFEMGQIERRTKGSN